MGNKYIKAHRPGGLQIGTATDKLGFFGATPIARTTAYTITNRTDDRALNCDSTADAELADVIATVIYDLQQLGILQ
jgi:hypothetical protein